MSSRCNGQAGNNSETVENSDFYVVIAKVVTQNAYVV
jgi:hypothetical protein